MPQRANDGRDGVPERRLEEPQAGADLVDDTRARRADRIGLPQCGDLRVQAGDHAFAAQGRQPGVVESAQTARDPLVRGEHSAPRRLSRVGGEHGLDMEGECRPSQLLAGDTGFGESCDRGRDRLA